MAIDSVTNSTNSAVAAAQAQNQSNAAAKTEEKKDNATVSNDTSPQSPAAVFTKSNNQGIDRAAVDKLLKESETANESIKKLLMDVMQKQG
ncbi:MAG: hypothetical protein LBS19_04025, partial [Clostridiales bacterium]|nr:hypothetical protein [Clostridiales bacterium]